MKPSGVCDWSILAWSVSASRAGSLFAPAVPGPPCTARYWASKNRFRIAAVGVGVAVDVGERHRGRDRREVGRLELGRQELGDAQVGPAGHAHLAVRVRLGAQVLDHVVGVAGLARREVVALERALAAAGAPHVGHRADHPARGDEVGREAAADRTATVGGHPEYDREGPRQRGLPVRRREAHGQRDLDPVVHLDQQLLRDALVGRVGQLGRWCRGRRRDRAAPARQAPVPRAPHAALMPLARQPAGRAGCAAWRSSWRASRSGRRACTARSPRARRGGRAARPRSSSSRSPSWCSSSTAASSARSRGDQPVGGRALDDPRDVGVVDAGAAAEVDVVVELVAARRAGGRRAGSRARSRAGAACRPA